MPLMTSEAKTAQMGRKLTALIIDDERPVTMLEEKSFHQTFLEFESISRWSEAQERLRSGTATRAADMLVVDVGWLSDPSFALVSQAEPQSSVQPFGPLLALPFLGLRPIMSCVLYSGHSKNESLLRNTSFLVAMGLIAARTKDIPRGGYDSRLLRKMEPGQSGALDAVIDEFRLKSHSSTAEAVGEALDQYREDLSSQLEDGVVSLTNRTQVVRQLESVIQRNKAGELVGAEEPLYIRLAADGWGDTLSLQSLFADRLNWGDRHLSSEWAHEVLEWLSSENLDAAAFAIEVILAQDQIDNIETDAEAMRPSAHGLIETMFGQLDATEMTEILRYVVLFANVHAVEACRNPGWKFVSERLAEKGALDAKTYSGWFGLRAKNQARGPYGAGAMRMLVAGGDDEEGTFLKNGCNITAEDDRAIRKYRAAVKLPADYGQRYVVSVESSEQSSGAPKAR